MTRRVALLAVLVALATQACVGPFARPKARPTVNTDPVPSSNTYRELTYVHPTAGFSLRYPEGMTLAENHTTGSAVTLVSHLGSKPEGWFSFDVTLPRPAPKGGLEESKRRICTRRKFSTCTIHAAYGRQWLLGGFGASGTGALLPIATDTYLLTTIAGRKQYSIAIDIRDDYLSDRQIAIVERMIASMMFQPSRGDSRPQRSHRGRAAVTRTGRSSERRYSTPTSPMATMIESAGWK